MTDNSTIAVIGGGPSGSLFSLFALKMANLAGRDIRVTIFEPKDFTRDGPSGCNHCGGVISEHLVQELAVEGINIPPEVTRRGINSYVLHTEKGDISISSPAQEKRIATVYRGGGPKGAGMKDMKSFDDFLLRCAEREGASRMPLKITGIKYGEKPVLMSEGRDVMEADLVVGAFGVNSPTWRIFEGCGSGYRKPVSTSAYIAEFDMGSDAQTGYPGDSIHFFLLPYPENVKFSAIIPKGRFATLCMLGDSITKQTVTDLFSTKPVQKVFSQNPGSKKICECFPKLMIKCASGAFADRTVAIGDAGSSRLFKDGIGASYIMGKAAAKTAVLHGVSHEDFAKHYYPVYRRIARDNLFGKCLYVIIDAFRKNPLLVESMTEVVLKEQGRPRESWILSSILWDMFTGNERYRNIFFRGISLRMHYDLLQGLFRAVRRMP